MDNQEKDRTEEILENKENVISFTRNVKTLVRIIGAVLVLLFGFLAFRGVDLVHFTDDDSTNLLLRICLALYYCSWIFGANSDTVDQENAYIYMPFQRLNWHVILASFTVASVFGYLCLTASLKQLAIGLPIFWCIDFGAWNYLKFVIAKPSYEESQQILKDEEDWPRLGALEHTYEGICGNWVIYRFIIGMILAVGMTVTIYTNLGGYIATALGFQSIQFTEALSFLLFLIVVEPWKWFMRIRTKIAQNIFKKMSEEYKIQRIHSG